MANKIEEARELVQNSVLNGKSGVNIARQLCDLHYSIEDAAMSLEEFGFVTAILTSENSQRSELHVSEGIALPGIAQLTFNILVRRLPKVEWGI